MNKKKIMNSSKIIKILTFKILCTCIIISFLNASPISDTAIEPSKSGSTLDAQEAALQDPFEYMNRGFFKVNQLIDGLLLKNLAIIYQDVTPEPVRDSISNVVDNLNNPVIFLNDLLQGEFQNAGETLVRFLLNTTIGVFGIFDVASGGLDIHHHNADFGQTLGMWGIGSGPYLVIPVLGPSSARDLLGRGADYFADPYNGYMRNHDNDGALYVRTGVEGVVKRQRVLKVTESVDKTADPYAQYRIMYMQNRDFRKISGKEERESPVPVDVIK